MKRKIIVTYDPKNGSPLPDGAVERFVTALVVLGSKTTDEPLKVHTGCRTVVDEFHHAISKGVIDEENIEFIGAYNNPMIEEIPPSQLALARQIVGMEPLPGDEKSIIEWATRLTADISKGKD